MLVRASGVAAWLSLNARRVRLPGAKDWKDLDTAARVTNGVARFEFDPQAVGLGIKQWRWKQTSA